MVRVPVIAALWLSIVAGAHSEERLPAYLLQLPVSTSEVFVAETGSSTLHRFGRDPGGQSFHDERYMSIGQNGVGKLRAWDKRTPLGIYFISEQLDTSGLHEKYGSLAFPLDYPNVWDLLNERSGNGIWIHGVDAKTGLRPPQDTDGCIALPNAELQKLEADFIPLITPIIITREIRWASPTEITATREELQASIETWVESYRSGDLHTHLAMYAGDFSYRGLNKGEWSAYRLQTIGRRPIRDLLLSDVLLLADPEEKGLMLSRFRLTIVDAAQTIVTTKRLYWRRSENGELRIIAEDSG
jgi:hypothetical protein